MKLKVINTFIDKEDLQVAHQPGGTLCTSDLSRVNDLVKRGLCEIESLEDDAPKEPVSEKVSFKDAEYDLEVVKAALANIGVSVAATAKVKGVTKALDALTEEQAEALSESLKTKEE